MSHVDPKSRVITCKAMVQWANGADLVEETIQVAHPKKGEVRIKVLASGVCHTDWSEPRSFPSPKVPEGSETPGFPVILGHEGGGIVESVGEGVESVSVGDHVIPLYQAECRNCRNCTSRKTNLCSITDETQYLGVLLDGTSRFSCVKNGKTLEILHFMGTSTFAEYTVVPECAVAKVAKNAPLETVCLLGCGVTTGYGAVHNVMKVEVGATAAVFGLGGVGLAVVMALKEAGASKIIGVDINPDKEATARKFGMTHFVNPKLIPEGDTVEGTVWQTNGDGLDYTFECIGSTKIMRSALECLHEGWGKCCIIGVAASGQEVSARPFHLVCGKTWTGCAFGGCRGRTQLPVYVDAYMAGRPPFVDEFVTVTMPHTEVNEAFHLMHDGKTLRSVITFPHIGDTEVAAHRAAHRKGAIIFLHGLGDKPESWQSSVEWLAGKINSRTIKAICPAAPVLPITKNDGERMPAWFDALAPWPKATDAQDDVAGIMLSVKQIHALIDKLVSEGVPAERIIVGGFSQGAATSTLAVYSYPKRLGGCLNLSGWVVDRKGFGALFNAANAKTPIFWGHGSSDEIIPIENQVAGVAALEEQGVRVTAKQYAIGHDSNEAEFDHILEFVTAVFAA
jgi:S-(hydroxymethyl)glutathione dehydrogenase/alcohol dehydrogenase